MEICLHFSPRPDTRRRVSACVGMYFMYFRSCLDERKVVSPGIQVNNLLTGKNSLAKLISLLIYTSFPCKFEYPMAVFLSISFGRDNAMCLRHFPELRKLYLTPLQFSRYKYLPSSRKTLSKVSYVASVGLWMSSDAQGLPFPCHVIQEGLVLWRHRHEDRAEGQIPWRVAETCYGHPMWFRDHITVSFMKKRKKCAEKLAAHSRMINRNNKTNKLAIA